MIDRPTTDTPTPAAEPAIRRILVPLDGSRLAEAAVPPALALAGRVGATLVLFHVLERDAPGTVHGEPHLADAAEATAYLAGIPARYGATTEPVETHVHADPARDVSASIVEHAVELAADLVVLASHGSGGIRGFLFGRVAQQVLRRGHRPVLLVQVTASAPSAAAFDCRTLVVLLNGTAEAELALPLSRALARAFGATLHLVYAVPTVGTLDANRAPSATLMPAAARAVLDLEQETAQTYLAAIAATLHQDGLPASTAVVRGSPDRATVDEARRVGADVLALATHGRQGLEGVWSGSIGAKVLGRFKGPLLLVRAPE